MIIGLDYDETIVEHVVPFYRIINEMLGLNLGHDVEYFYPNYPKEAKELADKLWKYDWYMNGCIRPKAGFPEMLGTLKDSGHEIHIITSRHIHLQVPTLRTAEEFFRDRYDTFCFSANRDKVRIMEELGVEVWVDDNADVCIEANICGIQAVIVDKPYNRKAPVDIPRIWSAMDFYFAIKDAENAKKEQG